ncbi:Tumor necrosis factor receptor superfamily member 26 [Apodemus speciosus]|uniref:Tumor necrosis factor receptor superfamily member 26 n=1 Tax=Apodemus speciosus TaxID=105296 RepID=A0ABQ0FRR0_APOSI
MITVQLVDWGPWPRTSSFRIWSTYLINPCQKNHGTSECAPCDSKHFLDHKNRESECFPCSVCRDDQEEVVTCSGTTDHCPDSKVIRKCNATTDTVCDTFDSKPALSDCPCFCFPKALNIVVIIAAIITIIAAVIMVINKIIYRYCKRDRSALNNDTGINSGSGNTSKSLLCSQDISSPLRKSLHHPPLSYEALESKQTASQKLTAFKEVEMSECGC